jgi:squalene-hopene/tetraprenyl-beta-curcumene cyclase
MAPRFLAAAWLIALTCWVSQQANAGPDNPTLLAQHDRPTSHSPAAARAYLDRRAAGWLRAPAYAGQRFACAMTCHTTLWYAPARAAVSDSGQDSATLMTLRAKLKARVDLPGAWSQQIGFFGKPGSDTRAESLGSEAVLNSLALALMDPPSKQRPLAERAMSRMWEAQRPDGAWHWMQFDQEPWEAGNVDWGATLAALAVGRTSASYQQRHQEAIGRLRSYLERRLNDPAKSMTLHDQLFLLWASKRLGWLTPSEQVRIGREVRALQQPGGAWSLRALLGNAQDRSEDGYATGLAALALCQIQPDRAEVQKALAWLRRSQRRDGAWPSRAISADHSSMADLHLRDGATSLAVMALAACEPRGDNL